MLMTTIIGPILGDYLYSNNIYKNARDSTLYLHASAVEFTVKSLLNFLLNTSINAYNFRDLEKI